MEAKRYSPELIESVKQPRYFTEGQLKKISQNYEAAVQLKKDMDAGKEIPININKEYVIENLARAMNMLKKAEMQKATSIEALIARAQAAEQLEEIDYTGFTWEGYKQISDPEEQFKCFHAMQKAETCGDSVTISKISENRPNINYWTFEFIAKSMMEKEKFAIFLGDEIDFSDCRKPKNKEMCPYNARGWAESFAKLQQIDRQLIRFGDFCKANEKSIVIVCATQAQLDHLNELKKAFSFNAGFSGKFRFDLMLAQNDKEADRESEEMWRNCAKVDCAFLLGNGVMNIKDNRLKIAEFVKEEQVVIYALKCADETLDNDYPLHADDERWIEEQEVDKYFEEVLRAFMKEFWKKALDR